MMNNQIFIGLIVEDVTHPNPSHQYNKIHNDTVKYQMEINRNENEHTIDRDTVYILINSS